jgi:hypothetical protein
VRRQDERGIVCDTKILRGHADTLRGELVDLRDERMRVEYDSVADQRQFARTNYPRRQQAQFEGRAAYDQRVSGIVAALETDHDIGPLRQPVDDLSLAFVAPLGADDHDIRHQNFFPSPASFKILLASALFRTLPSTVTFSIVEGFIQIS